MDAEHHDLQMKMNRSGFFGERRVDGWQYENELGELAWHVRTWPNSGDPIDDYWFKDGEFYEVTKLDIWRNMTPENRIEIGRRIMGMDAEKRDAMLSAIAEWEKPAEVEAK